MPDKNELITAHDLADSLNLSVDTIWRYTREKKIPYVELGLKQYRYQLTDVIHSLTKSTITYQDYLELPDQPGYRFEVLEGMLIKKPSPNVMHH